jgi:tetratricopeptide (TPR) repeat protein
MNIEQRRRLEENRDRLQNDWNIRNEKVSRIRQDFAIETSSTEKFKLEKQIEQEEAELKRLGDELNKIEAELLLLPLQTKTIAEKRLVVHQAIPSVPVWKGRDELLQELKTKLTETGFLQETRFLNPPKILALIGQGGIGKTSLAVKLLEALGVNLSNRTLSTDCPYECVMYFKTQEGASFDDVAEFFLTNGLDIQTAETLKSADEKIAKIIQGLAETRCLLVLDNLESILHPANHPQAGRAISADWGKLLNALVYQQHQSQTILTSREVPVDLADTRYEGAEPDSELVYIETLVGVATVAGVEILRQRQLKDSVADLQWISERVEGHVFLLTQLAAIGKGKPGYLRKHPELVTKKAEPILREQLARQSEAARDLLRRMCVLRVGIDIKGLTFLRLYTDDVDKDNRFEMAAVLGEAAEFTEVEISETEVILQRLADSSLVQSRYDEEKCEIFYDLHRLIVEFMQAQSQDEKPNLLKSVYKFYSSAKNVENPQTLEDLRPILEAEYFAFQLKNYSEAYYLVFGTLGEYLRLWGHWNLLKDLCEQILPYIDERQSCICLQCIGIIHRDLGNWNEAVVYFNNSLAIAQKQENKSLIAYCHGQLGDIERNRGNWDAAEVLYRQSLEVMTELGDRSGMAASWGVLGDIERKRGNWDAAEVLSRQSLEVMTELGDRSGMATSWGQLGDIERNRGNWDAAEVLSRQSLAVRTELGNRSGMAYSWGVLGDIERNRGNWAAAEVLFRQSLEVMTELGDRSGMAESYSDLGKNERDRGNLEAAEKLSQQALTMAQELGMTHLVADVNYDLAQLERDRGNTEIAQQHYNTAHQIYQQLGATKDLEKIEREWQHN